MWALKRLEVVAKYLLALGATVLLWRPGRTRRVPACLQRPRKILLVRIDDRIGEAVLMTPLISALAARSPPPEVDVLVHARAARVLEGHPQLHQLIALDRRRLWMGPLAPGLSPLRAAAYDVVVNCANWEVPSVTAALVSRLAAPRACVIGPAVWPVGALHDVAIAPLPQTRREVAQRLHLLEPLQPGPLPERLSFRAPRVSAAFEAAAAPLVAGPSAVVNPGGRLDWRRVPASAFASAARTLISLGRTPLVTWGPGEEALAREVAAGAPGSRVAPATNLDELAWLIARCGLTVCNNTGPMHLAVATGCPTLAFFLRMDLERWGYPSAPHRMVDLTAAVDDPAALDARVRDETTLFVRAASSTRSERRA